MKSIRYVLLITALIVINPYTVPANAYLVPFTLSGQCTANNGDPLGLGATWNTQIIGYIDNSQLPTGVGEEHVYFDSTHSVNYFSWEFPTGPEWQYVASSKFDDMYAMGSFGIYEPSMTFVDGAFSALDTGGEQLTSGYYAHSSHVKTNYNGNLYDWYIQSSYYGVWTSFELGAVPVPAAVWLLGSGLIGLIGIRRKINI